MKRLLMMLVLLLAIAPGAQAARTYRTWLNDTIKLYSPREQDWTYVTPENYQANMDLITGHGFSEEDAHLRFGSGEIVFEAYHATALKDGCLRLQVITTEDTQRIWDHTSLSSEERKELLEDLNAGRTDLPFEFRGAQYGTWNGGGKNNYVDAGFVSRPPYGYESGRLNMQIRNGKAYVLSYAAHTPSTRWDRIPNAEEKAVRERLDDMNLLMERVAYSDAYELDLTPAVRKDGVCTLELVQAPKVVQERGKMTLEGKTLPGAEVEILFDGEAMELYAQDDGSFSVELDMTHYGAYPIEIQAMYEGLETAHISLPVRVEAEEKDVIREAKSRQSKVSLKEFVEDPLGNSGEMISYEARVDEVTYERGCMKVRASTKDSSDKRRSYIIRMYGYAGDQVYEGMRVTYYGEIDGFEIMKSKTGEKTTLPCVQVDGAKWLVIVK